MKHVIDRKFREIHYPRDPGKWAKEKEYRRMAAYTLAKMNGPKMATMFCIKRETGNRTVCGMIAHEGDTDYNATAISWTDPTDELYVPCTTCFLEREGVKTGFMNGLREDEEETPRELPGETMEFWGAWPDADEEEPAEVELIETGGLDITFPIR